MKSFFAKFNKDVGIDLGTTKTMIYVPEKGLVINEPSVVAVNTKTEQIVAVGREAESMVGKTPEHIMAVKPIVGGVISDFEVTEKMIKYFLDQLNEKVAIHSVFGWPRLVFSLPYGVTEVERRAVINVGHNVGGREVYLIENPLAVALGARLDISGPKGYLVVDLGGGTTEVAIVSLNGIVVAKSIRIAGNKLNEDIIRYLRDEFKLAIGEQTAEEIKINLGSAKDTGSRGEMLVKGRDLSRGLPKEIQLTEKEVRQAISDSISQIVATIKSVIELTPPDLVADIMSGNILLSGGLALLKGLDRLIEEETEIPVKIIDDPQTTVVRGLGFVLENFKEMKPLLLDLKHLTEHKE